MLKVFSSRIDCKGQACENVLEEEGDLEYEQGQRWHQLMEDDAQIPCA